MDSSKSISPFIAFSFFLLFYSAAAFNITKILEKQAEFSTFNSFLSQTHIADEVNRRQTLTVLVVDNGAASALSGKPEEAMKKIMSVHVVLDYYDMEKLKKLTSNKSTLLTTLFQSTGMATNEQGFINVTAVESGGEIRLGSASPGAGLTASFIKSVEAQPFNISVLQISNVIVPPGIENGTNAPPPKAPSPAKSPSPSKAPSPAKSPSPSKAPAPAKSPSPSKAPSPAKSPSPSKGPSPAKSPSPSNGPSPVKSPSPSNGPSPAKSPSPSPARSPSPAPLSPTPSPDGPSSDNSLSPSHEVASAWATHITLGTCVGVFMGMVCMVAL
ncbi:fasciclin-like arabinogalactan protein 14 [Cinnamomum micranthum f. kanehirae]|uniref:Fasciclin-like arabinogalactan protein 14 n=1 Tax=Cinnamomum micranthum f. kanehirae TaxID=337451 RepID=A0A443NAC0_9MAGN|nr:fasciclin-like arabinogalactan protein 14 [Cinnamomum micranthum f. kanehirae]